MSTSNPKPAFVPLVDLRAQLSGIHDDVRQALERAQRQMDGIGAASAAHGKTRVTKGGKLLFELDYILAQNVVTAHQGALQSLTDVVVDAA